MNVQSVKCSDLRYVIHQCPLNGRIILFNPLIGLAEHVNQKLRRRHATNDPMPSCSIASFDRRGAKSFKFQHGEMQKCRESRCRTFCLNGMLALCLAVLKGHFDRRNADPSVLIAASSCSHKSKRKLIKLPNPSPIPTDAHSALTIPLCSELAASSFLRLFSKIM